MVTHVSSGFGYRLEYGWRRRRGKKDAKMRRHNEKRPMEARTLTPGYEQANRTSSAEYTRSIDEYVAPKQP